MTESSEPLTREEYEDLVELLEAIVQQNSAILETFDSMLKTSIKSGLSDKAALIITYIAALTFIAVLFIFG